MAQLALPRATRFLPALVLPLAALATLLGAAGCTSEVDEVGEPAAPYVPVEPDAFEVGTGAGAFQELSPGATVPIIEGGQGGYHIWISVRCGTCGPALTLDYGVDDAETGAPISRIGLQEWEKLLERDGWRQAVGLTAFLDTSDPSALVGRRARLWVTAPAADGSTLRAEAEANISGIEYSF